MKKILTDTGPLVALLDRRDRYHEWAKAQVEGIDPPLYTCEAVLSEACFLLRQVPGGPQNVLDLVRRGLLVVAFSIQNEASTLVSLLMRYSNVPMALADACMVRLSELNPGSPLLTFDSDFKIYRIHGRGAIPIVMPDA